MCIRDRILECHNDMIRKEVSAYRLFSPASDHSFAPCFWGRRSKFYGVRFGVELYWFTELYDSNVVGVAAGVVYVCEKFVRLDDLAANVPVVTAHSYS